MNRLSGIVLVHRPLYLAEKDIRISNKICVAWDKLDQHVMRMSVRACELTKLPLLSSSSVIKSSCNVNIYDLSLFLVWF